MKIQYASDLHTEFGSFPLRKSDLKGDILVRAKREWPEDPVSPLIDVQIGDELDFHYVSPKTVDEGVESTSHPEVFSFSLSHRPISDQTGFQE